MKIGRWAIKVFFNLNLWALVAIVLLLVASASPSRGAGLLKPIDDTDSDIHIRSHRVDVTINNGFARTEVDQVFANEGGHDLEAVYTFPLPKKASLSELSLWIDGQEVLGEVVEKERARAIYEDQKAKGNETALAEKDDFKTFNIHVGQIRPLSETRVRCVYYQPLEIDLNIGRYVYPLAEGNVDEERVAFWSVDDVVQGTFAFKLKLKSAFPVKDVRLPGHEDLAVIQKQTDQEAASGSDVYIVEIQSTEGANLSRDIVFYYRLDDTVPGRVELIPYREDPNQEGTLMAIVTPAASLARISEGVDWIFVLDISGSMDGGKIGKLTDGVARVLGKLSPHDRFRIVTFNNKGHDFTGGYVQATDANAQTFIDQVRLIRADGGTALFEGLEMAYGSLDDDRTTGIILVTDGVCNVGPTKHDEFLKLMEPHDLRLFTFVIGNSANQPLMERLARDSGGFAMNISESDDMVGRLIQAKAKVLHECLHDVELKFRGEKVKDLTPARLGSLYMGQQLVVFGRYTGSGDVKVELKAKISGQEQTWRCTAFLPDIDTDNPELERLWALSSTEDSMEIIREEGESKRRREEVVALGTEYSLVTDYTSMLVLREDVMETEAIERKNAKRVTRERQAQQTRAQAAPKNYTVQDSTGTGGMFQGRKSHSIGSGAVGPLFAALIFWMNRKNGRRGK
ncbi:MAG: VIT domain-containing protein [Thermodesulfobacteriota bacterium]|nr:VIT domain-containing protein [Thermodesulfobacteriota bacterium]